MAYDEELAFRLRAQLEMVDGITDKRMFGGMAFLLHGYLALAASGQGGLLVRVDPADAGAMLQEPCVEPMEMGGRRPKGWLRVRDGGFDSDEALARWVRASLAFAGSLPPK